MSPWAHSSTLTLCAYMFDCLIDLQGTGVLWHLSTYSVRTAGHFARFTPDSDFFHHTFCTVHTVHTIWSSYHPFTLCWCLTLVVNLLLTTIVHHIFSSVLAEPHFRDSLKLSSKKEFRSNTVSIRVSSLHDLKAFMAAFTSIFSVQSWLLMKLLWKHRAPLGKLATLKVCRFMSVLTPLVDWPLKRQVFNTSKVE